MLSDDGLCNRFSIDNNFEKFILRHKSELEIILYTRNVIEFCAQRWGPYLKTGLGTLNFEEHILEKRSPYNSILWWLKAAKKYKFVCKVKNY